MNKNDVVKIVAERTSLTQKDVLNVVDSLIETLIRSLCKGEEINLAGFGKFVVKKRKNRESINPRTKEVLKVPSCRAVSFKPGKQVKEEINKK